MNDLLHVMILLPRSGFSTRNDFITTYFIRTKKVGKKWRIYLPVTNFSPTIFFPTNIFTDY